MAAASPYEPVLVISEEETARRIEFCERITGHRFNNQINCLRAQPEVSPLKFQIADRQFIEVQPEISEKLEELGQAVVRAVASLPLRDTGLDADSRKEIQQKLARAPRLYRKLKQRMRNLRMDRPAGAAERWDSITMEAVFRRMIGAVLLDTDVADTNEETPQEVVRVVQTLDLRYGGDKYEHKLVQRGKEEMDRDDEEAAGLDPEE